MALPTTLTLELVTPDRAVVRQAVDEVQIPGSDPLNLRPSQIRKAGQTPFNEQLNQTIELGRGEAWQRGDIDSLRSRRNGLYRFLSQGSHRNDMDLLQIQGLEGPWKVSWY